MSGMNFAQMQRRIEALEAERGAVLRFGTIVGVDETSGSARVQLEDADKMVSYPLRVLQSRTLKDQHQEMPDLGEHVACVFSGQGFEQGLMLGAVYSDADACPGLPPHIWYRKFADGTVLQYDREEHKLFGIVKGEVDMTVEKDVQLRVLQKLMLDADDDVTVRSGKTVTIEGAVSIILRTPSLIIQGLLGKVCSAMMTATFRLFGLMEHSGNYSQQGNHQLSGDVNAGGSVMDSGGNTNHHSH